jgi:hypothetical protein
MNKFDKVFKELDRLLTEAEALVIEPYKAPKAPTKQKEQTLVTADNLPAEKKVSFKDGYGTEGVEYDERLVWLLDRDLRKALFEKSPNCFIPVSGYGRAMPIFCVCNREGVHDKKSVEFSLELAKRLAGNINIDPVSLKTATAKMEAIRQNLSENKKQK